MTKWIKTSLPNGGITILSADPLPSNTSVEEERNNKLFFWIDSEWIKVPTYTNWIMCSHELPTNPNQEIIFRCGSTDKRDESYHIGTYDENTRKWLSTDSDYMAFKVTHWMPLPEIPKD